MSYSSVTDTINSLKSQTNATNYEKNKANGNDTVNQDVFLQLMITQLQNQDPLNPMDNSEFLSQQAMFSQVSTMQEMNENLANYGDALLSLNNSLLSSTTLSQAMNIVGKEITATDPSDSTKTITGVVDSVKITDDGVLFSVNGQEIKSDSIQKIGNNNVTTSTESAEDTSLKESAKSFLSDVLTNPKLKSAATNIIEKFAGNLL